MTSTAGQLLLTAGLAISALLAITPLFRNKLPNQYLQRWLTVAGSGTFLCLALALALLVRAMAQLDFSLEYVVSHTSQRLPMLYRITGTWGGHEGSLLLWTTALVGWMALFAVGSRRMPSDLRCLSLSVMALVSLGFQLLMTISSPFVATSGTLPTDGRGLNPMLQDIGLAIHPPTLYIGYAGITVVFGVIMAALWLRLPVKEWLPRIRTTAMAAWSWLTLGIALGSWWAYLELGWGGWWFWDPVENASLMPWLTLTSMLHAMLLCRRNRSAAKAVVTLAITSLGLILIGMFIVRSGVISSVHAFTTNPKLGLSILGFLLLVTAGGFLMQLIRPPVEPESDIAFNSSDILLIAGSFLLVLACTTVLLGTLYPIILEVLNMGQISVGPAYFNTFFVPITLVVGTLLFVSTLVTSTRRNHPVVTIILLIVSAALATLVTHHYTGYFDGLAIAALTVALMVLITSVQSVVKSGASPLVNPGTLAHIGLALAIAGGTLSERGSGMMDVRMAPGQSAKLGQTEFLFTGTTPVFGPNYLSDYGFFDVIQNGQPQVVLHPEKRLFPYFGQVMTEVGHQPGLHKDFYVALGEPFDDGSWAVRLKIIPWISLLWGGALLMVLSGCALSLPALARRKASFALKQNTTTPTHQENRQHA